jgi:hypothetical protein
MADLTFTAPISTGGIFPAIRKNQTENGIFSGYANLAALSSIDGYMLSNPGAWAYTLDGYLYQLTSVSPITWTLYDPASSVVDATTTIKGILKLAGDLSGTASLPSVVKINSSTVPAGGSLTTGNVLQVSGSSALTYAAVNLAGGSNYVTGVLPNSNQASQTMGGDVSGTTAAATVIKINGTSVPATPSANQVLVATGSTTAVWSQIYDGYVASSAAIAGTKISPDFGSQAVSTTGTLAAGATTLNNTTANSTVLTLQTNSTTRIYAGYDGNDGYIIIGTNSGGTTVSSRGSIRIANPGSGNEQIGMVFKGASSDGYAAYTLRQQAGAGTEELHINHQYSASAAAARRAGTVRIDSGAQLYLNVNDGANGTMRLSNFTWDMGVTQANFTNTVSSTCLTTQSRVTDAATKELSIRGQGAHGAATGTNRDAGIVAIEGGQPADSNGRRRALKVYDKLQTDSSARCRLYIADINTGQTSWAHVLHVSPGASVGAIPSTTDIPDGDGILAIGACTTEPVANPGNSYWTFYNVGGNAYGHSSGGVNQSLIPTYKSKTWPSDADYTLPQDGYQAHTVELTGGSLTATRTLTVPLPAGFRWAFYNNTSGGQIITVKGSSGTGVDIANGKHAMVYSNGTNIVRITPDT